MADRTPFIAHAQRERAAAWASPAPGQPCSSCGVRPDVDCQHRPGSGQLPIALREEAPKDKRKVDRAGQGLNFRAKKRR